jgi:hypothetical protein
MSQPPPSISYAASRQDSPRGLPPVLIVVCICNLFIAVGSSIICGLAGWFWWNAYLASDVGRGIPPMYPGNSNYMALVAMSYGVTITANVYLVLSTIRLLTHRTQGLGELALFAKIRLGLAAVEFTLIVLYLGSIELVNPHPRRWIDPGVGLKEAAIFAGIGLIYPVFLLAAPALSPRLREMSKRIGY